MKSIGQAYYDELEYIQGRQSGEIQSLKTPWPLLNEAGIEGLEFGTINTLAAMSGVGKTAISNQIVFHAAELNKNLNISVLFFTVEMGARRLVARYASSVFGMPVKELYNDDKLMSRYRTKIEPKIKNLDMQFVENMYTPAKISQITRQFCSKRPNRNIIVIYDHSLLIKLEGGITERNALIDLAKEFNMAKKQFPNAIFFILSQLNRDIESSDRIRTPQLHYPKKSDIFGSDALYQMSDIVGVAHKPSMLEISKYGPQRLPTKGIIYMHLLKVREGAPRWFPLKDQARINRFPQLTHAEYVQYGFMKNKLTK